jgi:hypothetical protein
MGVVLASPQVPAGAGLVNGYLAALPRLTQPSFLTGDPFEAYLLSLTDPAAQALAALQRSAATPAAAPAGSAVSRSAVLKALVAGAASPGLGAASPFNPGPAAAAFAAAPGQAAIMAASTALPLAQAAPAAGSEADTQAQGRAADTAAAEAITAANAATDAITAANAAAVASLAAANALRAAAAASEVASGLPGLATDATAKFMGAGAMGQPAAVLSSYQEIQGVIPAVNGVLATSPMAANTSSNPQGRTFGRTAAHLPAPGASAGPELDLNA